MNALKATKRTTTSTGQINKLRSNGFIPAILYGGEKNNISISYVQGTGDTNKAQAKKISIKKAQANAQATRYRRQGSRKVLQGTRLVDFARNNFLLLQFIIILNCKKTLDNIK